MCAMPLYSIALTQKNPETFQDGLSPQAYSYMVLGEDRAELLSNIIQKESRWCYTKWNGQYNCPEEPRKYKMSGMSSAYGLCQTMMSLHGDGVVHDFKINPYAQVDWCIAYALKRYGSLDEAWQFWQQNKHW
jgi:hypothetical protein